MGRPCQRASKFHSRTPELLQPLDPFLRDMEDGTRTAPSNFQDNLVVDGFAHLIEALWITPRKSSDRAAMTSEFERQGFEYS